MLREVPRDEAKRMMEANHYLHRFPTGWTRSFELDGAYVTYSIPANQNLERFLFDKPVVLRELARLWAPDGHAPNLLTRLIAQSADVLRRQGIEALVSFADPNMGHAGGVYRAASWQYTGQSSETRGYRMPDGTFRSRRAFHSGSQSLIPNLPMVRVAGKHRFVRPLTKRARRALRAR